MHVVIRCSRCHVVARGQQVFPQVVRFICLLKHNHYERNLYVLTGFLRELGH